PPSTFYPRTHTAPTPIHPLSLHDALPIFFQAQLDLPHVMRQVANATYGGPEELKRHGLIIQVNVWRPWGLAPGMERPSVWSETSVLCRESVVPCCLRRRSG